MALEHWGDEEIRNLKTEKERLVDQEERENIWKRALSEPDGKWHLPARLEEEFREGGFPFGFGTSAVAGEMSIDKHYIRFRRNLIRGACEYLTKHAKNELLDNRITQQRIFNVLHSSKEFGALINHDLVHYWIGGKTHGFEDIIEEYGIDHSPHQTINARYAHAIKSWWLTHPSANSKPTYSAVARILKLTHSSVLRKINDTPALLKLMKDRPSEKKNEE